MEYKNFENLVYKLAWSWHHTTGIDIEELISEANLAYCRAAKSYKPGKATKSTWIYSTVNLYLRAYCQKELRRKDAETALTFSDMKLDYKEPERWFQIDDILKTLSDDAKNLINIILASPGEFLDLANDISGAVTVPKLCKKALDYGMKWEEARLARLEIKQALREVM